MSAASSSRSAALRLLSRSQARVASSSSFRSLACSNPPSQSLQQQQQQTLHRTYASKTAPRLRPPPPPPAETPAFPCLDANDARTQRLIAQQGPSLSSEEEERPSATDASPGPEPSYTFVTSGFKTFHHPDPLPLDYGGILPEFNIAYETWGQLNEKKDNAILIHTGLSASSHARSHSENTARGWWEDFIGPGKALDTDRFFVMCTNVLGSCYGSTGPSSPHPQDPEGTPYGTRFPILSIFDMVRAQFLLLDHLGIKSLFASLGSSMGGMQSIAAAHLAPERVQRVVSISGCARSGPSSIALRFAQRSVLMSDPNWNRGHYYGSDRLPPHTGMKLARQIATITYRSGPEWEQRFGRRRRKRPAAAACETGSKPAATLQTATSPSLPNVSADTSLSDEANPALCPDFEIETYLDHQGESFCLKYDANSLIYISKAMDLFDMSEEALEDLDERRSAAHGGYETTGIRPLAPSAALDSLSSSPSSPATSTRPRRHIRTLASPSAHFYLPSLSRGLSRLRNTPTLIIGAQSDILFPIDQQRELAECLRMAGNAMVRYSELDAPTGHDTFLLDVNNVGGQIKGFLA